MVTRRRPLALLPRAPHEARGFTLLELIVSIAVLGILTVMAVPAFQYLAANTKIKSASSNLHLSLLKARSEAVKRDANVVVTATGGAWHNGWTMAAGGTTLLAQEALKGVTVSAAETSVTFRSSGRPSVQLEFEIVPAYASESQQADDDVEDVLIRCVALQANGAAAVREATC